METGAFWLVVSCVTYLPLLYLPCNSNGTIASEKDSNLEEIVSFYAGRLAQQQNIAIWLSIILPLYTINYLVALFGGIDVPTTIEIF